jgi:hypothetical protein
MSTYEINFEFDGRNSKFLMGMYVASSMADDIDMLGWNLCDCDDEIYKNRVGNCRIVTEQIKTGIADLVVELDGIDEELKEKTIEDFLDCFKDFIWRENRGLWSRTGEKYEFSLKESNFDLLEIV